MWLGELKERILVKHLPKFLTHRKRSLSVSYYYCHYLLLLVTISSHISVPSFVIVTQIPGRP